MHCMVTFKQSDFLKLLGVIFFERPERKDLRKSQ